MTEKILFYAGRHGQTDANAEDRMLGHTDIPLNASGIEHARLLGRHLADKPIRVIYASPLKRAFQTAGIVAAEHHGPAIEVITDDRLMETNFGELEYMTIADARRTGIYAERDRDRMTFKPPGGESYDDLLVRLRSFFKDTNLFQDHEPALIISHQGTTRMIAAEAGAMPMREAAYASIPHETLLTVLKTSDGKIKAHLETLSHD